MWKWEDETESYTIGVRKVFVSHRWRMRTISVSAGVARLPCLPSHFLATSFPCQVLSRSQPLSAALTAAEYKRRGPIGRPDVDTLCQGDARDLTVCMLSCMTQVASGVDSGPSAEISNPRPTTSISLRDR